MTTEFKRKLYKRGSSFETTIPMPLLFALDKKKKYNVIFLFDPEQNKWYIKFLSNFFKYLVRKRSA